MNENFKCPLCGECFESEDILKSHTKSCFDSYHSSCLNQTSIDPASANRVITSQPIAANSNSLVQQPVASRNAPVDEVGCCYGCCCDEDGEAYYSSDHQRGMTTTTSSTDHMVPHGGGGWFSSSGDNGGANDDGCKWDSGGGDSGTGGGDCGGGDSGGGDCGGGGGTSSCD